MGGAAPTPRGTWSRGRTTVCPLSPRSVYTVGAVVGLYHHLPGASLRKFATAIETPSDAKLAALVLAGTG